MNIKKTFTLSLLVLLCAAGLFAQTATTSTTLTAAITERSASSVSLASATNVFANGFLLIDNEVMAVTGSYVSGSLTVPVRKGASGTAGVTHAVSSTVYVFAPGLQARLGILGGQLPGSVPTGACTRGVGSASVLPVFNTTNGQKYDCLNSNWTATGEAGTVIFCGATSGNATCANATGVAARSIGGIATLVANSAVISGISPPFVSTSTFTCTANDITTRANPVQVVNTSTSSVTITNTTGATDVISWNCVGY